MVSIVEAALLLLLMVLSIAVFIGLYYFFKRTLPVEQRKKQRVVDTVEESEEVLVPMWIPWNWGGREGSTYDRSMPQYYPGPRPRPMGLGPRPIASGTIHGLA